MQRCFVLLFTLCTALVVQAQDDYVIPAPEPEYVEPLPKRSFGFDLFGPAVSLLNTVPERLHLAMAGEWWTGPKRSWRADLMYDDERDEGRVDDLLFVQGTYLAPVVDERSRTVTLGIGLVVQDHDKRIATRIGASFQTGWTERSWDETGRILVPDSACGGCLVQVADYAGSRYDSELFAGLAGTVGITGRLGRHWMVEFRFPLQVRAYLTLEGEGTGAPFLPDDWGDAVRFGLGWPGLYLHRTW